MIFAEAALVLGSLAISISAGQWIHVATLRAQGRKASSVDLISLVTVCLTLTFITGWVSGSTIAAAGAALAASGMFTAVSTDLRFQLVADLSSVLIAAGALIGARHLSPELNYLSMGLGAIISVSILGLAGLYAKLRRGHAGLGSADLILAMALGLWCDGMEAALAISIGALITLLYSILRQLNAQTRLPFAPGLIFGFCLVIASGQV